MKETQELKLNDHKLMWHQNELDKWKKGDLAPPIMIDFGPTSWCNHRCVHCYIQDTESFQKPLSMREDIYFRFMKEIGQYGVKAVTLGGCGEPFLHKSTTRAIEIAVENGTDVAALTNGIPIRDKDIPSLMQNMTYLRFSVNGGSAKSYAEIHKCKPKEWDKIRSTLRKCVEYKKQNKAKAKCTLGVYTLVFDPNLWEMEDWVREVKDIGVDYIIIKPPSPGLDSKKFVEHANLKILKPRMEKLAAELKNENFEVMVRMDLFDAKGDCNRNYDQCVGLPFMCAVDSDGAVYSCNWYWGEEKFKYGNLYEKTFPEIWASARATQIKEFVSSPNFKKYLETKCGFCRQNSLNNWLWKVKHGEASLHPKKEDKPPAHINFI